MRIFFASRSYTKKAHIRYVGGAADGTADGSAAAASRVAKSVAECGKWAAAFDSPHS
jgi:hypothetical protein